MERFARRRLRFSAFLDLALLGLAFLFPFAAQASRAVSFNLSTERTFSPQEQPKIHLYARGVDVLEFRVYRVDNPETFLANLPDLHSFGNGAPWGPKEQIDERTWLERFHDWKHHLWFLVRRFFRGQFSEEARDYFRQKQSSLARRSRIVGVAQFAQIPLLNDKQLVARWQQEMPPTYVSDSQDLPIDPLRSGMYLLEATDGHFKAYTMLMVSRMVLVTRTSSGNVLAYAVDRQSGAPVAQAQVKFGFGKQEQGSAQTDSDGIAELHGTSTKEQRDNLWVTAARGGEFAAVTPSAWSFNSSNSNKWASYVYTDRPVYRPGNPMHWKAILRARVGNHLELPQQKSIHAVISDEQDHAIFERDVPISNDGAAFGDVVVPAKAALGYYTIRLGGADDGIAGSFRVEEYRKPEYQVRVSAQRPRLLQGESMQVVIDARYFFGEPVAFGKVKYRVYHAPHYWWDEGGGGGDDAGMNAGEESGEGSNEAGDGGAMYDANQQSEQTGTLDANGKLTINVPTQLDGSSRHQDLDYPSKRA